MSEGTYERAWNTLRFNIGQEISLSPIQQKLYKLMDKSWAETITREEYEGKIYKIKTNDV